MTSGSCRSQGADVIRDVPNKLTDPTADADAGAHAATTVVAAATIGTEADAAVNLRVIATAQTQAERTEQQCFQSVSDCHTRSPLLFI